MKEVLKKLAPALRAVGFRGSGQNYRKVEGDFVFVINFQGSSSGKNFYVNLGAQPFFIPARGQAEPKKLKEYQCFLRRRVGTTWPWQLSDEKVAELEMELLSTQSEFFKHVQTMRAAIAADPPDVLLQKFSLGTTQAAASLDLARAAFALGQLGKARELATIGIGLAGDVATILRAQLKALLQSIDEQTSK